MLGHIRWFPEENLLIPSARSPEQIAALLQARTDERSPAFRPHSANPFWGKVDASGFTLRSQIGYPLRNSFRPVLYGTLYPAENGTVIQAKLRLSPSVRTVGIILLCLILCFLILGAALVAEALATGESWLQMLSVFSFPFGVLVFDYLLTHAGFRSAASAVRRELCGLLAGEGNEA